MGVKVIWHNEEKTIVRHVYDNDWRFDEVRQAAYEAWDLMRSVPHPVDAIFDLRETRTFPKGSAIDIGKFVSTNRPSNARLLIILNAPLLFKGMYDLFRKVYKDLSNRVPLRFAATIEEALQMVAEANEKAKANVPVTSQPMPPPPAAPPAAPPAPPSDAVSATPIG